MKRFETEVNRFAQAMLETLNTDKNRKKPSNIQDIALSTLIEKYREEKREFESEIQRFDLRNAPAEIIDLANTLMMIWIKIKGK